ncbi:MAG: hypothetical protein HUJ90_06920 [Bacteroidales bacterium]|nr:hypothetical protein [Bacteroidales bacterium]
MQNKLQELTDKLYNEGLSKGKQEADAILAAAKKEAAQIVADAQSKASQIEAKAKKDADDLKTKVENDVKMASAQTIAALKSQIENSITAKVVGAPVKEALSDADFVKGLIEAVVKSFNAQSAEPVALDVVLPQSMKEKLGAFVEKGISKELSSAVNLSFSKGIAGGFTIAPKDGGYFISFAEDHFEKLLGEYLRPATKKILFS